MKWLFLSFILTTVAVIGTNAILLAVGSHTLNNVEGSLIGASVASVIMTYGIHRESK